MDDTAEQTEVRGGERKGRGDGRVERGCGRGIRRGGTKEEEEEDMR